MKKIIGKEGTEQGLFNVMRLAKELSDANIIIKNFFINKENGDIELEFSDEQEAEINLILQKHIPEPLPIKPTKEEQLEKELTATQLALAEVYEMILGGAL